MARHTTRNTQIGRTLVILALLAFAARPAEARLAGFFKRLVDRVAPKLKTRSSPTPQVPIKPAPDITVEKLQPYQALVDAKKSVGNKLYTNVRDHVTRVHNRQLSYAMQRGGQRLTSLDLDRMLPNVSARTRKAIKSDLEAIERAHLPRDWFGQLDQLASAKTKSWSPTAKAKGMLELKRQIEQIYGQGLPKADRATYERDKLPKLSRWLLARHSSWSLHKLLPAELPALPASKTPFVQEMIKRARTHGPIQKQLAYLDRQLAQLAGTLGNGDNWVALKDYLRSYKEGWSRDWLRQRLTKFSDTPAPVSWDLKSNVTFEPGVDSATQTRIKARLDEAWTAVRGVVHPEILKILPAVKVHVSTACDRANHSGTTITLDQYDGVGTILHEFGHHIEDHGGKRIYFAALGLRADRSFGSGTMKLQELARDIARAGKGYRIYKPNEVAYVGDYFNEYIGKQYGLGATEVISVGLEMLGHLENARLMYAADGNYTSTLLHVLQQPPRGR